MYSPVTKPNLAKAQDPNITKETCEAERTVREVLTEPVGPVWLIWATRDGKCLQQATLAAVQVLVLQTLGEKEKCMIE